MHLISKFHLTIAILLCFVNAQAQVNFSSSNLPIMIIETQDQGEIPDDPKIDAHMSLINNGNGNTNLITDFANEYDGKIGIEIRGSSSAALFPKKGFGFETRQADGSNNNVGLLGMPEENDWVLHGPYSDKSLIRNALAYLIAADLMEYAPRVRHIELVVNDEYRGVYLLTEKIKRDKERVDISKLNPGDIEGDQLTGGYIIKVDKSTGSGSGWRSEFNSLGGNRSHIFLYHDPKFEELEDEQIDYIQNYIFEFESMMDSDDFNDPITGYSKWIDEDSFMAMFFVNEISKNVDGYRLSTYFYKDRDSVDSRLISGPVWDYNLGFGNANYCDGETTHGWAYEFNDICLGDKWNVPFFWEKLYDDLSYRTKIKDRWTDLRSNVLSNAGVLSKVDSLRNLLQDSQVRNFNQWPILGEWVWPNFNVSDTYNQEIFYLRDWLLNRLEWMDEEIELFDVDLNVFREAFVVFPSPANQSISITIPPRTIDSFEFLMHDAMGRLVLETNYTGLLGSIAVDDIDISFLADGVYYYTVLRRGEVAKTGSWMKR